MRLPASLLGASAFLLAGCSSGAPSASRGGAAATTAPPASSMTGGAGSATGSTARLVHPGRLRPGRLWDLPRAGRPRKPPRRRRPEHLSRPDQRHHMGRQASGHVPLRRHAGVPLHRGLLPRDPGQHAPGTRAAKCWGNDRRDALRSDTLGRAAGVGLGSCPCVVHDKVPVGSRTGGPRIAAARAAERLAQACPSPGTHRPGAAIFPACRFASRRVSAAGSIW